MTERIIIYANREWPVKAEWGKPVVVLAPSRHGPIVITSDEEGFNWSRKPLDEEWVYEDEECTYGESGGFDPGDDGTYPMFEVCQDDEAKAMLAAAVKDWEADRAADSAPFALEADPLHRNGGCCETHSPGSASAKGADQ